MESISTVLLEYGAMGIFAAFLVWQHLAMQKRLDSMVAKFQEQLDKIRGDQKQELSDIRSRYEAVIQNQHKERENVKDNFFDKLSELEKNTENILEILQEQKQEKKLKELAKKMVGKDAKDTLC